MSNILQKLFIETPVLIPGYTIRHWNPSVTNVVTTKIFHWVPGTSYSETFNGTISFETPSPYYTVVHYADGSTSLLETGVPLTKKVSFVQINALNGSWSVIEYFNADGSTTTTMSGTTQGYYVTENVTNLVTTPGYYSYTVQPDTYSISYSPNTGWNSSARSIASVLSNGTGKFSPRVDVTGAVVGLNEVFDSSKSDYFEISFGIYFNRGYYRVVEQGVFKTNGLIYQTDDIFSVSRTNNEIFYAINDQVFYKSSTLSYDELLLDCSLYSGGDSIYNASLSDISDVIASSAFITALGNTYAQPKATANVLTQSNLTFRGVYSSNTGVNANVNITAVSVLTNNKQFGGYPNIAATSTLTSVGHSLTGIQASLGGLTVKATSGYEAYAEIIVSLPAMTASAGAGFVVANFTYIAAAFESITSESICLTGETNLDHTVSLQPMSALLSNKLYAGITGSFGSMDVYAGQFPDLGNYAVLPFITSSISASGYSTDLNSGTLTFIDSTIEGYGGAITEEAAVNFVDLSTFSCTGTHLDYGNANIAFSTFTLSGTGIGYGTSNTSIGFISSTITSFGGTNAAITAPVFGLSSTGSYIPLGGANLDFLTWSISSTGMLDATGNATIGFPTFTSVWGSAALPAPFLNLAATGSVAIANSVAYVLNIMTNESTRYTNQIWDHIVVLGNKPYGVTSTGLYLLEGATDNGVAIDTYMATKETDLGTNMAKSIPTIYLNSDTQTYTTAYMDGVAQTPQASSFTGRKCHLSRGAEARYVKLKISGIKNLQGLEILPELKSRRVK